MKRFKNLSVRKKITVIVLSIVLISLGFLTIFAIHSNIRFLKEELLNRMQTSAEIVGDYIVSDIEFDYPLTTNITLKKLTKYNEIKNVLVFKSDSTLFAKFSRPGYENFKINFSMDNNNYYFNSEYLYINHVIYNDSRNIVGTIFLRTSTNALNKKINSLFLYVGAFVLLVAFVAIYIGIRLSKSISRPILNLVDVMNKITKGHEYTTRVIKESDDEIGALYDGFNGMMEQIIYNQEERIRALISLRKSEENFKTIFNSSHDAIFIHDEFGKIFDVNDTMLSIYKVSRKVALKSTISDYSSDKNDYNVLHSLWKAILEDGKEVTINWIAKRKSKKEFFAEVILRRIELNGYTAIMATVRDITVEYEAKKALEESEKKLKTMFKALPVGVGISKNRAVVEVNDEALRITGLSREDIIGKNARMLYKSEEQFLEIGEKIYKQGQINGIELNWIKKGSGEDIFVYMKLVPLDDSIVHGEMLFSFIDITALKNAEKEIRLLNEELEERVEVRTAQLEAANKELEAFSYSVSHDLRSPLRALDGFSLALFEDYNEVLDDEGRLFLIKIRTAAQRMSKLIDDLIKLSRSGRGTIKREKFMIDEVVGSIINTIKDGNKETNAEFIISVKKEVFADLVLIRAVLENLIGNAFKFSSKKEKPIIEFGMIEKAVAKQKFGFARNVFFVKDNGAGFNMKYVEKIFGVFQRLHNEKDFEGSGIGLATVQKGINRHGGKIWAEGEVNKGAVFYFTIG